MSGDTPMEKMRVCPSCRMQISVLATKCRFCGEEVGKPKDETRTLSIHDLGGEQVYHRAPSGSVMEALESFRVDETLQRGTGPDDLGIELDPTGKIHGSGAAPSAADFDFKPAPKPADKKKPASSGSRMGLVVAIVAALVLVVVAITAGPAILEKVNGPPEAPPVNTHVNQAPGILARGGPAIEALEAAVEAIGYEDSPENRRIAEDCVQALVKEVRELLNTRVFDAQKITQASNLAASAVSLYPNEVTRQALEEAKTDDQIYKMMLVDIDRTTDTAKFKLVGPGSPEVLVKEKDLLADRFYVRSIVGSKSVTLTDTKRNGRPVQYEKGSLPLPVE